MSKEVFKLIMIYGPPAVGKLTVAQELEKVTGYKLLHNHRIADAYGPIFGYGTDIGRRLNVTFRGEIYEAAAKSGLPGLISTFTYYGDQKNDDFMKELIERLKPYNGAIYFVRLICSEEELRRRVIDESRKKSFKITSIEKLQEILTTTNVQAVIPEVIAQTLTINNTNLSPQETAVIIKEFYKL